MDNRSIHGCLWYIKTTQKGVHILNHKPKKKKNDVKKELVCGNSLKRQRYVCKNVIALLDYYSYSSCCNCQDSKHILEDLNFKVRLQSCKLRFWGGRGRTSYLLFISDTRIPALCFFTFLFRVLLTFALTACVKFNLWCLTM